MWNLNVEIHNIKFLKPIKKVYLYLKLFVSDSFSFIDSLLLICIKQKQVRNLIKVKIKFFSEFSPKPPKSQIN